MGFSGLGAGFPVVAKKVTWLNIPQKAFFACKHFGTGVLIATAFVHVRFQPVKRSLQLSSEADSEQLLPTAFFSLSDPCLPDFFTDIFPPITGVIMMVALFALFTIEMYLNHKMDGEGHSHGGSFGNASAGSVPERPPRYDHDSFQTDASFEKRTQQQVYEDQDKFNRLQPNIYGDDAAELAARSEMPPWFVVFYEQYVRQRLELINLMKTVPTGHTQSNPSMHTLPPSADQIQMALVDSPYIDPETGLPVSEQIYKKMSMNITLLEGGILFHSVFVGMLVSITIEGFVVLLVAILFHQLFEGLGLGARIAAVPYAKGSIRPWMLVLAFSTTAPIGQTIGLVTRGAYDPNSAFGLIIVGVFNAMYVHVPPLPSAVVIKANSAFVQLFWTLVVRGHCRLVG